MLPVLAVAAVALLAGGGVATVARQVSTVDLSAPRLNIGLLHRQVRRHPRLAQLLRRRLDPARATGLLLTAACTVVALAMAALGVLLVMVRRAWGLARSDTPRATWAAEQATEGYTDVLRLVSTLGGTSVVACACAVVGAVGVLRTGSWTSVWLLLTTVGGQFALVAWIKWLVARARPDVLQLSGFSGEFFPSGHAAAAAATYPCAALLLGHGRSRRTRTVLAALAAAIAGAVAATRVLHGVHWFTDTLAGAALGWGWFALCSIAFGGRALRFGRLVAAAEEVAAPPAGPDRMAQGERRLFRDR